MKQWLAYSLIVILAVVFSAPARASYTLRIERSDCTRPIAIQEWKAAVKQVPGARLQAAEQITVNPNEPSMRIKIPISDGNVEVYVPKEKAWNRLILWSEASRTGNLYVRDPSDDARPGFIDAKDPIWIAAANLAKLLHAEIRGQQGEIYDLATGKVLRKSSTATKR